MVGEATRTPIVQEVCKEIFGVEQVSRTTNSLECVARGCSLQAAILSPTFKVAEFGIDDYNLNPVSLSYEFAGGQPKTSDLFTVGSAFPLTKSITFDKKAGNLKMMLQYQDGGHILEGLPK